jgi:hypothetical protein
MSGGSAGSAVAGIQAFVCAGGCHGGGMVVSGGVVCYRPGAGGGFEPGRDQGQQLQVSPSLVLAERCDGGGWKGGVVYVGEGIWAEGGQGQQLQRSKPTLLCLFTCAGSPLHWQPESCGQPRSRGGISPPQSKQAQLRVWGGGSGR